MPSIKTLGAASIKGFRSTAKALAEDTDGVPLNVENGVTSMDGVNFGDGNGDGTPDGYQNSVASFKTVVTNTPYVTIEVSSNYALSGLTAEPTPSNLPRGVTMIYGALGFTISGVTPGGTVEVAIYIDTSTGALDRFCARNRSGNYVNIAKSVTTAGNKRKLTFELTDGGIYDSSAAAGVNDGVIVFNQNKAWA